MRFRPSKQEDTNYQRNNMAYSAQQIIKGANDDGTPTGEYFPRSVGHTGQGKHHFAVSFFIINSKGELLLQLRKHKIFDKIWDTTGSTHQLRREDELSSRPSGTGTDETDEEACDRSFKVEYGVPEGGIKWENYGGFNYFAKYGEMCENEHDMVLIGQYDGEVNLNPEEGYEIKWMGKEEFLKDIKKNPKKYTPWAIGATKLLEEKGFFKSV